MLVRDWRRSGHPRALGAALGTSASLTAFLAFEASLLQLHVCRLGLQHKAR